MAKCKYCGDPITWAKTAKGKLMPMNSSPDPEGEWTLDFQGDNNPPRAHRAEPGTMSRYKPHWATCPHAAKAREEKRQRKDIDG